MSKRLLLTSFTWHTWDISSYFFMYHLFFFPFKFRKNHKLTETLYTQFLPEPAYKMPLQHTLHTRTPPLRTPGVCLVPPRTHSLQSQHTCQHQETSTAAHPIESSDLTQVSSVAPIMPFIDKDVAQNQALHFAALSLQSPSAWKDSSVFP